MLKLSRGFTEIKKLQIKRANYFFIVTSIFCQSSVISCREDTAPTIVPLSIFCTNSLITMSFPSTFSITVNFIANYYLVIYQKKFFS